MFGWYAGYVKRTEDRIKTTEVSDRIKVVAPQDGGISYTHFLPFIGPDEPAEPLKSRNKRRVFFREVNGNGFYLKKYSYRFTRRHFAPFRGFIWSIPIAQRQMQKMLFLRERGAGVVEPVMSLIRRYGLVKQESLLVMRECRGVLLKHFLREVDDFRQRLHVISQTFRFLQISHANNIHHGDLTTHNFIVTPGEDLMAFDLDERKTKWLGALGNRKELRKWVGRSVKILGIDSEDCCSARREEFERMLANNYPAALKLYHKHNR